MRRKALWRSACLVALTGIVLFGALALTGCGEQKAEGAAKPVEGRLMVVLLDLSASTRAFRSEYKQDFQRLTERLDYGDHLVVLTVDTDSIANSRLLVDEVLPTFEKTDNMKNELIISKAKQKFAAENPIEELRTAAASPALAALDETMTGGSDILGALELASQQLERSKATSKSLVVLSDMILRVPALGVDFQKQKTIDPATEIVKITKSGGPPKLTGANVVVVGATAKDQNRWKQIRGFWSEYFSAAGATMPDTQYGRRLSEDTARALFTD